MEEHLRNHPRVTEYVEGNGEVDAVYGKVRTSDAQARGLYRLRRTAKAELVRPPRPAPDERRDEKGRCACALIGHKHTHAKRLLNLEVLS
jgi:hypothetical protein